ncbi:MAG: DUF58 domain-containing protein [Chloroflexota bacterium]|nr:DUF58 domain-containing protein [Chloroflexota bacterium]
MLTRRGVGLLAVVALPLFLAIWAGALVWVAGALFVGIVALIVRDSRSVPPADAFTVAREHEPRLSVGTANPITLKVGIAHGRSAPLVVQVREEPPPHCAITPGPFFRAILPPGGEPDEIAYTLRPGRRGPYAFGPVTLRIPGVRNLVVRQRTVTLDDPIRVYPNIRAIRVHDLAARRSLRAATGLRRTRRPGEGSEFERLREYTPDDEYRRIDWKATARRGKPIARTFEAERAWNVMLLLDAGRLMGAPVGDLTKLDVAVNAALLVAHIGARQGDRIGLLAFADRVEAYIPPASGPRQGGVLLESLYAVRAQPTATDYREAFTALAAHRPQRSLVILLTDITDSYTPRALIPTLVSAAARHRVVVVTLRDPELDDLAHQLPTDPDAIYARVAAERLGRERALLLATIAGRGIETHDVPADRLSGALIDTYLDLKRHVSL